MTIPDPDTVMIGITWLLAAPLSYNDRLTFGSLYILLRVL